MFHSEEISGRGLDLRKKEIENQLKFPIIITSQGELLFSCIYRSS